MYDQDEAEFYIHLTFLPYKTGSQDLDPKATSISLRNKAKSDPFLVKEHDKRPDHCPFPLYDFIEYVELIHVIHPHLKYS